MPRVSDGWSPTDTAAFLGAHVETVRKWARAYKARGDGGLAGTPHPGRRPFLTPTQEAEARGWLTRMPTAFGFRTDPWAAARVAQPIKEKFGVEDHPNYLREWLSKRRHTVPQPDRAAVVGVGRAHPGDRRGRRAPAEGVGHRGGDRAPGRPPARVLLRHRGGRVLLGRARGS